MDPKNNGKAWTVADLNDLVTGTVVLSETSFTHIDPVTSPTIGDSALPAHTIQTGLPDPGFSGVGLTWADLESSTPSSEVSLDEKPRARKESTEKQYQECVRCLYNQSSELRSPDDQNPFEPSPIDMVRDLIESTYVNEKTGVPKRSYSSWSLYRAALLWYFHPKRHLQEAYEIAYQMLVNTKIPPVGKKKGAPKLVFKNDDFEVLINTLGTLDRKSSNWGSKTAYWLQAGVAAGARGIEWRGAAWLDRDKFQLLIPNSKIKASAPAYQKMAVTDDEKVVSVYDLDDEYVLANPGGKNDNAKLDSHRVVRIDRSEALYVDLHLASLESHALAQAKDRVSRSIAFRRYNEMCRRTLRKACEIAFRGKRYYRLHIARSQFSANRKVDHSLGAVASMMGHSGTRTTMSSYGSRADGLRSRKGLGMVMNQTVRDTFDREGSDDYAMFAGDTPD